MANLKSLPPLPPTCICLDTPKIYYTMCGRAYPPPTRGYVIITLKIPPLPSHAYKYFLIHPCTDLFYWTRWYLYLARPFSKELMAKLSPLPP